MCVAGFPVAVLPLWQLAQFAMIPVWFIRAPANVTVLLWQVSQGTLVTMWLGGFPIEATPLWQAAQPPVTPAWLNLAPGLGEFDVVGAIGAARVDGTALGLDAATLDGVLLTPAELGFAVVVVVVAAVEVGVAADAAAVADLAAVAGAAVGAAVVVAVAVDLTAAAGATTAGTAAAVVEHPAGDFLRGSKLVVLVWQQPQSAVVEGWSLDFPSAPFVP